MTILSNEQVEALRQYVAACEDPDSGLSGPYGRMRAEIVSWPAAARKMLDQHDELARLRAENERLREEKAGAALHGLEEVARLAGENERLRDAIAEALEQPGKLDMEVALRDTLAREDGDG